VREEDGAQWDGRRAIRDNLGVGAEALVVCGVELGASDVLGCVKDELDERLPVELRVAAPAGGGPD
jgi:hypothetical protein